MNAAAEIIHGVAHPDANIIFGTVIDDEMGDEVKVTVIAAGFDRLDGARPPASTKSPTLDLRAVRRGRRRSARRDDDDDFDVPSFLPLRDVTRQPRRRPRADRAPPAAARSSRSSPSPRASGRTPSTPPPRPAARRSARTTPRSWSTKAAAAAAAGLAVHFIGAAVEQGAPARRARRRVRDGRPAVARRRARPAGPGARVLVQVNATGEPGKGGCPSATSPALVEAARRRPGWPSTG